MDSSSGHQALQVVVVGIFKTFEFRDKVPTGRASGCSTHQQPIEQRGDAQLQLIIDALHNGDFVPNYFLEGNLLQHKLSIKIPWVNIS